MQASALLRTVVASGLAIGILGSVAPPAAAQGSPVGGVGNHYLVAGSGNPTGRASVDYVYGDPDDEVYVGDFVDAAGAPVGDGVDDTMIRRGNTFLIRGPGARAFAYGDVGDTVLVGDWDGNGTDTLAVRRGNTFFVKNDVQTGRADYVFAYGDPGDTVLVGNWDGDSSAADSPFVVLTDTLMVRRGNHYFVKNTTTSGRADYDFHFGDGADSVLVGDWATPPVYAGYPGASAVVAPGQSGDYADQLAVRRGNVYHESREVWQAEGRSGSSLAAARSYVYGNVYDTAFSAQLSWTYVVNGTQDTLYGDGLAVRRFVVQPAGVR